MKLDSLYRTLAAGELTNLSMAESGAGSIAVGSRTKLLTYINAGLLRLHTRFPLVTKDVLLLTYEHITNYHLIPRFAVNHVASTSAKSESIRYILDLPQEPFLGDVIRILSLFDSEGGELPLNDDSAAGSAFTPQANVLQIPNPVQNQSLSVLYQARHAPILGDLEEEITIPECLEEALTSFIAYKVFSHMNTKDSTAKAVEYENSYEAICLGVVAHDLVGASVSTTNVKFDKGGWV